MKTRHCYKHNEDVEEKYSKTKKKFYCVHVVDGKDCFVNTEEEMDGFREKQVDYAMDNALGEYLDMKDQELLNRI